MRAAVFIAPGRPLSIETLPDPQPLEGEVVVRVARCGVCATDLHSTSEHGGRKPGSQIGHEYAGEVVEVGKGVSRLRVGDRVAGMPIVGCGACEYCKTGIDILCQSAANHGRGLAEFIRVPEHGTVRLPRTLSGADGSLVEPLAVARRGVRLANPGPGTRALVIGPGPIGLGLVFWLRRLGVRRLAVLASSDRRRALAEAMGAEHFVVEGEGARVEIERALAGPPDVIFEAAGVPGVLARSIDLVRPQGEIVALGFCNTPETIVAAAAVLKDVTLRFSITYTREDYKACAEALDADAEQARAMVTDVVSLSALPEAFEALRDGRTGGGKLACDPWLEA
jgi:(R,R)-butanediol dehydrogenase/meso-butanediol dehydrogenase/diacetyl reductase